MDINDVKFSVDRFEKMINDNSLLFFDSFEFESIVAHYLENGKIEYARKAIDLSLNQHPTSSSLILLKIELLVLGLYHNQKHLYLKKLAYLLSYLEFAILDCEYLLL